MARPLVPTWNKITNPDNGEVEVLLHEANQCMDQDNPQRALDYADQVISLDPRSVSARFVRGSALTRLNRVHEALHCYQDILSIEPTNANARYCINILHTAPGHEDEVPHNHEIPTETHQDEKKVMMTQMHHLWKHGDIEQCLEDSEKFLSRYPDDIQVLEYQALCHARLGRLEAGVALFDTIISLDTDPVRPHYAKARMLYEYEMYREAETVIMGIPKMYYTRVQVAHILGHVLLCQQKHDEALLIVREGLSQNKNNPHLLDLCSKILVATGDLTRSLEIIDRIEQMEGLSELQQVEKLSLLVRSGRGDDADKMVLQFPDYSDDPGFLYNLALTAFDHTYPDAALILAKEFVTRFPKDPEGWTLLGGISQDLDLHDDATAAYSKAIELDQDFYPALSMFVDYLTDNDKYEEASLLNSRCVQINRSCENLVMQGWILGQMGDFSGAYEVFFALSKEFPDNEVVWLDLGWIYDELGKNDEARAAYLNALEINPELGEAWNNLGAVNYRMGRVEEAGEAFKKALFYLPDDPDCRGEYAEVLFAAGEFEEAAEVYRQYLVMKPEDADAWFAISDAYSELGRYQEALSAVTRGLEIIPDSQQGKRLKAKIEFRMQGDQ